MSVTIYKHGPLLRIRTSLTSVIEALKRELQYRKTIYNATYIARQQAGGQHLTFQYVDCYEIVTVEKEQQLVTPSGYYDRVVKKLNDLGVSFVLKRQDDLLTRPAFKENWDLVADFDWRHKQKETLKAMLVTERGQVWQATGTGKSWIIVPFCLVLNKARIVITTKHIQVLEEHYHRLATNMGDVGIICSGRNIADRRVMCVSAGSLHRLDPDKVDIVLADEHHELGTDRFIGKFAAFKKSRMYGLSANVGDRTDNSDFELEGIFGKVLTELSYQEGVDNDMVVPIEVEWHSVKLDHNPADGLSGIPRKKRGIWGNEARNQLIADVANGYVDEQVLITVETVEHACRLKKLLPDYSLCYSASEDSQKTVDSMYDDGVLMQPEDKMTPAKMFKLKRDFELGICKKVIATSVWNRGVNFHQLQVLIRADGAANTVADTQIPGRLARLSAGKTSGRLVDFLDEFDHSLALRAKKRMTDYKAKGWAQLLPEGCVSKKKSADDAIPTNSRRRNKSRQS